MIRSCITCTMRVHMIIRVPAVETGEGPRVVTEIHLEVDAALLLLALYNSWQHPLIDISQHSSVAFLYVALVLNHN